jgi:hypothetical protein
MDLGKLALTALVAERYAIEAEEVPALIKKMIRKKKIKEHAQLHVSITRDEYGNRVCFLNDIGLCDERSRDGRFLVDNIMWGYAFMNHQSEVIKHIVDGNPDLETYYLVALLFLFHNTNATDFRSDAYSDLQYKLEGTLDVRDSKNVQKIVDIIHKNTLEKLDELHLCRVLEGFIGTSCYDYKLTSVVRTAGRTLDSMINLGYKITFEGKENVTHIYVGLSDYSIHFLRRVVDAHGYNARMDLTAKQINTLRELFLSKDYNGFISQAFAVAANK